MYDPFRLLRREMEDMFRVFDRNLPSLNVGPGVPTIDVAETTDAIEVSAELPGVDEKDIKVSLDGNRLVISGEKKEETKKDEKDWHVEERSYGSSGLRGLYYAVQQARIGDSLSFDPFAFDQNGLAAPEVQALRGLIPWGCLGILPCAYVLSTVQVTCGAGGRRPARLAAGGVLIIAIFHARFDHGRLIYHLS